MVQKIDHIGIAVHDIDHVLPFYTNILGLTLEKIEEVPSEGVKVAFLKINEVYLELLEPLHNQSPLRKFLQEKGEGIHHIAVATNQLNRLLQQMKAKDVPLINEEPKQGANNKQIAFIHPKATNGVLFELCKKDHQ